MPDIKDSTPYRRIVVKAGTALLTHGGDRPNLQVMASLVEQVAQLHLDGVGMILVTSGAVASGRHVLGVHRVGKNVPLKQVLAAIGQGRLMNAYEQLFDWHQTPVAQALLTRHDLGVGQRLRYLNVRNTLLSLLELGVVPIINENDVVAVDELAGEVFGDNDNLSAMVANVVDADLLVLLGEVEGFFTADPYLDPNAELIPRVDRLDENIKAMGGAPTDQKGRGGMATKLEATRLATASGVNTVIASGLVPDVLIRLAQGERIGTYFPATSTKMESRKRWMLSSMAQGNNVLVDAGASRALLHDNRSLLPAGVTGVQGVFERGDLVSILDLRRVQIAVGITNYSSEELDRIKGLHSSHIEEILGIHYGDEVVHRDNLVTL